MNISSPLLLPLLFEWQASTLWIFLLSLFRRMCGPKNKSNLASFSAAALLFSIFLRMFGKLRELLFRCGIGLPPTQPF